nr:helix-turn-helix domain-containing protein [Microlunatus panaciterrae]
MDQPPTVVGAGIGVHGLNSNRDHYQLPHHWSLHLYRYHATITLDGVPHTIRPGSVSLVAPGVDIEYAYRGVSEHLYAHLALQHSGSPRPVLAVQDAGSATSGIADLMMHIVGNLRSSPAQASAEAWTALHRVVALSEPQTSAPHPAVTQAISYIEANLAYPLEVARIAELCGLSHNHLTRVFRQATAQTVVGYIRHRRLQQARHLLQNSTLPIAAVARSVGYTDLQAFNKACHHEFGAAPRTLRAV